MEQPVDAPEVAWQPFTFSGVARFARASTLRLLAVQIVFALVAGGCVGWFAATAWVPVITRSVDHLPEQGQIQSGLLEWKGESPVVLEKNGFLAIAVDHRQERGMIAPADLYVQFSQTHVRLYSFLGYTEVAYPQSHIINLNRAELAPRWGAWMPVMLVLLVTGSALGLMATWGLLSLLYMLPVKLIAFFANRSLDNRAAWRISGAALLPGAVVMSAGVVCYGLGLFDLPELGATLILHFVTGWIYATVSPALVRSKNQTRSQKNPFGIPGPAVESAKQD